MTLTRLLNQKNLLAYTGLLFVMLASASQMASTECWKRMVGTTKRST